MELCLLCKRPRIPHFRSSLEDTLMDTEITEEITQQFETTASQYITVAIENICGHFPQAHTLTLVGHLVPQNVS